MKIAVCLKLVPTTNADIRVAPDGSGLLPEGVETGISLYDDYALETALQLREAAPGSTIHALSVGGDEALKCLRQARARGADSVLHVRATGLDTRAAALAAAAALKPLAPDLVLCGRQALDDDLWLFPGALAELLQAPHVAAATQLAGAADGMSVECRRRFEDVEQVLKVSLPAVISCDKGRAEPRVPTLKARLAAKKKQPPATAPEELGLPAGRLKGCHWFLVARHVRFGSRGYLWAAASWQSLNKRAASRGEQRLNCSRWRTPWLRSLAAPFTQWCSAPARRQPRRSSARGGSRPCSPRRRSPGAARRQAVCARLMTRRAGRSRRW
ncbi:MAG: electron transfer flavoprotein subunit beta/FixA family protein [Planctomycetota bacterium]|nr:electron transfer flavoprotein subunit beta/FixA family protein [Planctomycetota bacterium]